MADTSPDYVLSDKDSWVDIYSITGVTPGTSITIQNKSARPILIQYKSTQPTSGSKDGYIVNGGSDNLFVVPSLITKVWINGFGKINVQPTVGNNPISAITEVSEYDSRGGFGDRLVSRITPLVQLNGAYSETSKLGTTLSGTGTAAGIDSGLLYCSSGTTSSGVGAVYSFQLASYHPGQCLIGRYSAIFDTPSASSYQFAGISTALNGFWFGYNGNNFGIVHRKDGAVEIRTLTVTTPAGSNQTATITINGTAYSVPLTIGTAAYNAREIAESLKTQTSLYRFTQNGSTVTIRSIFAAPAAGVWSFSSSTAVASFSTVKNGVTPNDTWYYQANWNGVVPTGFDPTKGNVYQIQMQYLGFGNIHFFIEDSATSKMVRVHTIRYSNNFTTPSVSVPSFRIGYVAANVGNTTSKTVKGGSCAIFLEGEELYNKPKSISNTKAGISTTDTNIITIRNRETYTDKVNLVNIKPEKIYGYTDSTKGVVITVLINATLGGTYNYSYVSQNASVAEYDTAATTVTGGTSVATFLLGNGTTSFDLSDFIRTLNPSETLTIAARIQSGPASEVGVSVVWQEDF